MLPTPNPNPQSRYAALFPRPPGEGRGEGQPAIQTPHIEPRLGLGLGPIHRATARGRCRGTTGGQPAHAPGAAGG